MNDNVECWQINIGRWWGGTGALTSANQLSSTGYSLILGNRLTCSLFIYLPISKGFVTAGAGERPLACVQTKMALQYPRPVKTLVAEWAGMTASIIASAVVIVYFNCRLLYMCINYFINPDETLKIYTFFNLHFVHCRWHTFTSSTRENLTFTFLPFRYILYIAYFISEPLVQTKNLDNNMMCAVFTVDLNS